MRMRRFEVVVFIQCISRSGSMETCSSAMSTRVKQRAVIEFLTAEKVTPTEIHRRLKAVYGDDAVDRSTVNRWVIKFRGCEPGKAIIVDETRSGRPITATDDNHRKCVDDLIQNDRRITQKRIANHIGISKERVGFIIEQLGYRKICAGWVPHRLTDENKQRRLECCKQLLQRYRDEGDDFLLNIVMGDESWVHQYDPEEKRQSAEYRHPSSPQVEKFKTQPSAKKLLLTVFWDAHRVYVTDFLERGATVNSSQYIQTLKHLQRRVCRVRGSLAPIILQHDNARPHTSRATEEAVRNLKFEPIPHPPYSPDLAPCDFYFFPQLKRDLKGNHYTSDDEMKAAVQSWIREKSEEFFSDGMKKLVTRWEKCVSFNGNYIEK